MYIIALQVTRSEEYIQVQCVFFKHDNFHVLALN